MHSGYLWGEHINTGQFNISVVTALLNFSSNIYIKLHIHRCYAVMIQILNKHFSDPSSLKTLFSNPLAIVISHRESDLNVNFKSSTAQPAALTLPVDYCHYHYLPRFIIHFFRAVKQPQGFLTNILVCWLKLGFSDIFGGLVGNRFMSASKF